jgi:WD40 repeat protein
MDCMCSLRHTHIFSLYCSSRTAKNSTWGSPGSATPLILCWHPTQTSTLVVGRQDGVIDILSDTKRNQHRVLSLSGSPVRSLAVSPDGSMLGAGNDAGVLCVWDVNRTVPVLVHHVLHAHKSWILALEWLPDSRRFVTVGAERNIRVWSIAQLGHNLNVLQLGNQATRLLTGSDTGWIQVFSLER